MPRRPAFSARIVSRSSALFATISANRSFSKNLMRSRDCTGTFTYVGFIVRWVSTGIHLAAY